MKIIICKFITKKKIILNDSIINYSGISLGHLINIPRCNFINYYIEYIDSYYSIYGLLDDIKLNNIILNENLLYRKELFRLLQNIKTPLIINKKLILDNNLNIDTIINYTIDNYLYINDYGLNLTNEAIIKKKHIINKKCNIVGGLIYITSKYCKETLYKEFYFTHDIIKKIYKKLIQYGKNIFGATYTHNEIINILKYEKIDNILDYNIIIIDYSLLKLLNHIEIDILKLLNYKYIWFVIDDMDINETIYKLIYQLLHSKKKIITSLNYINEIRLKCSYIINYEHNYNVITLKKDEDQIKLLEYIDKYVGTDIKILEYIPSLFYNDNINIKYLKLVDSYECEICYDINNNGYIKCCNGHMFCQSCYISNYLLNSKCAICQNNNDITWYIDIDKLNDYRYGSLVNLKNKPIYINNKLIFNYFNQYSEYTIINNLDNINSDIYLYNIDHVEREKILFNHNNKYKLSFLETK